MTNNNTPSYDPYNPYGDKDPGGKIFPEDKAHSPFPGISISEIAERLKIGKNYVSKNISADKSIARHTIPSSSGKGAEIIFNGYDVRKWLIEHATFTRQTRRIHPENFKTSEQDDVKKILGAIPIPKRDKRFKVNTDEPWPVDAWNNPLPVFSEKQRKNIITITVKPFDFWDKKLYFPKEYYRTDDESGEPLSSEHCYRDMFLAGAIKIQLGKQKTMFYIPDEDKLPPIEELRTIPIDDTKLPLVPAAWEPFYGYIEGYDSELEIQEQVSKEEQEQGLWEDAKKSAEDEKPRYRISFNFDFTNNFMDSPQEIEKALKKSFIIDHAEFEEVDTEQHTGKVTYTIHLPPSSENTTMIAASWATGQPFDELAYTSADEREDSYNKHRK